MVSEKKNSITTISIPGVWPVLTQELDWQDLRRGPLDIVTYLIIELWASWLQKKIFKAFPQLSMGALCFPLPDDALYECHHIWPTDKRVLELLL